MFCRAVPSGVISHAVSTVLQAVMHCTHPGLATLTYRSPFCVAGLSCDCLKSLANSRSPTSDAGSTKQVCRDLHGDLRLGHLAKYPVYVMSAIQAIPPPLSSIRQHPSPHTAPATTPPVIGVIVHTPPCPQCTPTTAHLACQTNFQQYQLRGQWPFPIPPRRSMISAPMQMFGSSGISCTPKPRFRGQRFISRTHVWPVL